MKYSQQTRQPPWRTDVRTSSDQRMRCSGGNVPDHGGPARSMQGTHSIIQRVVPFKRQRAPHRNALTPPLLAANVGLSDLPRRPFPFRARRRAGMACTTARAQPGRAAADLGAHGPVKSLWKSEEARPICGPCGLPTRPSACRPLHPRTRHPPRCELRHLQPAHPAGRER